MVPIIPDPDLLHSFVYRATLDLLCPKGLTECRVLPWNGERVVIHFYNVYCDNGQWPRRTPTELMTPLGSWWG